MATIGALPSVGKRIGFRHEPHNSAATLQITMSQELVNGGMRENYRRIGELPDNRSRRLLSG
tara:strand:- start:2108 stop:2293 length:186 start_codon:yes stop_codon:yes gene_type:complete